MKRRRRITTSKSDGGDAGAMDGRGLQTHRDNRGHQAGQRDGRFGRMETAGKSQADNVNAGAVVGGGEWHRAANALDRRALRKD
eukprot:COSAG01_NODE_5640_length_4123_cov_2.033052_6_plen_84_part_00